MIKMNYIKSVRFGGPDDKSNWKKLWRGKTPLSPKVREYCQTVYDDVIEKIYSSEVKTFYSQERGEVIRYVSNPCGSFVNRIEEKFKDFTKSMWYDFLGEEGLVAPMKIFQKHKEYLLGVKQTEIGFVHCAWGKEFEMETKEELEKEFGNKVRHNPIIVCELADGRTIYRIPDFIVFLEDEVRIIECKLSNFSTDEEQRDDYITLVGWMMESKGSIKKLTHEYRFKIVHE